jgi:hypothetical protein
MAEENNKPTKPKKSKSKSNIKLDKGTIIFFAVLIIALIGFTILVLVQELKTTYVVDFGEEINSTVEINEDRTKIDLIVNVQGAETKQHGTLTLIEDNEYKAELKVGEDTTETVTIIIEENQLKLMYDDGTEIIYKEK